MTTIRTHSGPDALRLSVSTSLKKYRWEALRNHPADGRLGEFVTQAMREVARLNPPLQGVLDVEDFNEQQSGQRTLDDDRLESTY